MKIIAAVEFAENKFVSGFGGPQSQCIDCFSAVADNRSIVGDSDDFIGINPVTCRFSVLNQFFNGTAEINDDFVIRTFEFPRIAVSQPVVRKFDLIAVFNFLIKNSVIVTDSVTESRDFQSGKRIEKTGSQTSQSAVSQTGVDFFFA